MATVEQEQEAPQQVKIVLDIADIPKGGLLPLLGKGIQTERGPDKSRVGLGSGSSVGSIRTPLSARQSRGDDNSVGDNTNIPSKGGKHVASSGNRDELSPRMRRGSEDTDEGKSGTGSSSRSCRLPTGLSVLAMDSDLNSKRQPKTPHQPAGDQPSSTRSNTTARRSINAKPISQSKEVTSSVPPSRGSKTKRRKSLKGETARLSKNHFDDLNSFTTSASLHLLAHDHIRLQQELSL